MPPDLGFLPVSAALSSAQEFRQVLIVAVVVGVLAFAVCGGILAGFIRSLQREGDHGDVRFTRASAWWLASLIASLLAFSAVFMWHSFA